MNVSVSIIIIAILSGMLLILFHGLVRFRWYFVIHTLLFTGIIIQLVFNLKKIDHWFFYSPVSLYMVYIFYMISVISVYFVYKREKWLRKASVYAVILIQFLLVTVHRWNKDIYITPDKLFVRKGVKLDMAVSDIDFTDHYYENIPQLRETFSVGEGKDAIFPDDNLHKKGRACESDDINSTDIPDDPETSAYIRDHRVIQCKVHHGGYYVLAENRYTKTSFIIIINGNDSVNMIPIPGKFNPRSFYRIDQGFLVVSSDSDANNIILFINNHGDTMDSLNIGGAELLSDEHGIFLNRSDKKMYLYIRPDILLKGITVHDLPLLADKVSKITGDPVKIRIGSNRQIHVDFICDSVNVAGIVQKAFDLIVFSSRCLAGTYEDHTIIVKTNVRGDLLSLTSNIGLLSLSGSIFDVSSELQNVIIRLNRDTLRFRGGI